MKIVKKAAKAIASVSAKSAKSVSNSASLVGYYQPKEPAVLKRDKAGK